MESNIILDEIDRLSIQADELMTKINCSSKNMQKIFSEANIIGGKIYPLLVKLEGNELSEEGKKAFFRKLDILINKIKLLLDVCQNIKNKYLEKP